MIKAAKDYLKQPYSRAIIPVGDGTYFAEILEFPGCFAEGQTPDEAYKNLEAVAESWIEAALEQGQEIPSPIANHDFSGRIVLRIPKSIHKQAARFAEMDDTSLNQFFLSAIAERVGAEEFFERLLIKLEAKIKAIATTIPTYNFSPQNSLNVMESQYHPSQSFAVLLRNKLQPDDLSSQFIERDAGSGTTERLMMGQPISGQRRMPAQLHNKLGRA